MKSTPHSSSRWARVLVILATSAIGVITLTPGTHSGAVPFTCVGCGGLGLVEFLWNVMLFVPLGFAIVRTGRTAAAATGWALGLSVAVEAIQFFAIPSRDATVGDLLANGLGGGAGALIGLHIAALLRPPPRLARRLAAVTATVALVVFGLTAWLSAPSLPADPWFGQVAPELGQYASFPGHVLRATLNRERVPSTLIGDWERLRRVALTDGIVLETRFVTGPPTPALAPIVSVFDARHRRVILLGQDGRDLRFEVRLRSEEFRLRAPGFILGQAVLSGAGDTVTVRATFANGRYLLQVAATSRTTARRFTISPDIGWALIAPVDVPLGLTARLISTIWVILLVGPPIYYLRRASISRQPNPVS